MNSLESPFELGSGRGKRRRSEYDIWASILDALIEGKTLNGIKDAARVNQKRLKHHLDGMVSLGLVRADRSRRFTIYSITDHGVEWRESYKGIATGSSGKEDHDVDFRGSQLPEHGRQHSAARWNLVP